MFGKVPCKREVSGGGRGSHSESFTAWHCPRNCVSDTGPLLPPHCDNIPFSSSPRVSQEAFQKHFPLPGISERNSPDFGVQVAQDLNTMTATAFPLKRGCCCPHGFGRKKENSPLWGSTVTNQILKMSLAKQMVKNKNIWKKQKGQPHYSSKTLKVAALAVHRPTSVLQTLVSPDVRSARSQMEDSGTGGSGWPRRSSPHTPHDSPTNIHNKSPSHIPSASRDQGQAAPRSGHRTLPLSLSEGMGRGE